MAAAAPYTGLCLNLGDMTMLDLVTKSEAAEILGVDVRTVHNLILRGELPKPKAIGRRVYWLREEFECFVREALHVELEAPRVETTSRQHRCPLEGMGERDGL